MVRETIISDPEAIELLSTRFVPVALRTNQPDLLAPEESKFLLSGLKYFSTAGCFVFTAGGKQIPFSPRPVGKAGIKELKTLLANFRPEENLVIPSLSAGSLSKIPQYPEGSQVLYFTFKVLDGLPEKCHPNAKSFGIGHVAVTKEEIAALARGQLSESLKRRMFTKTSPFTRGAVKKLDLVLRDGRLSGEVSLETKKNDTGREFGYEGDVLGFVDTKDGKITRFDVVMKGTWWYLPGKNDVPSFDD